MTTTKYIWDPDIDAYLMDTDGSDATQAVYTTEPVHFGRVISQRRSSVTNYLHQDAVGSTRQLTGAADTTTDSWIYDAWGCEKAHTGSTITPLTWVGQLGYYLDSDLTSYYVRRRAYMSPVARWRSADPLNNPYVDPSNYVYVRNAPLTSHDPSGLIAAPSKPGCLSILQPQAAAYGIPIRLIDDLWGKGACFFEAGEWPRFLRFWNYIQLPADYLDENQRCPKKGLSCFKIAVIYNELWHAWWDTVLEEHPDCQWLYHAIRVAAADVWTGSPLGLENVNNFVEMAEEAMSESVQGYVESFCLKKTPEYKSIATSPAHDDKGEKWHGNKYAKVKMSKNLYNLLEHALLHGCDRVGAYAENK